MSKSVFLVSKHNGARTLESNLKLDSKNAILVDVILMGAVHARILQYEERS